MSLLKVSQNLPVILQNTAKVEPWKPRTSNFIWRKTGTSVFQAMVMTRPLPDETQQLLSIMPGLLQLQRASSNMAVLEIEQV